MKALVSYCDWLIWNRGEIRPEVGDKIIGKSGWITSQVVEGEEKLIDVAMWCVRIDFDPNAFEEGYKRAEYCYRSIQEIDKKNHAIEFVEWVLNKSDVYSFPKEKLYQQFLNEKEV